MNTYLNNLHVITPVQPLSELYFLISQEYNCCHNDFYLQYHGKPLNPNKSLHDYGINSPTSIQINFRLRGGQPKPQYSQTISISNQKQEKKSPKLTYFDYVSHILSQDKKEEAMSLDFLQKRISNPNNSGRENILEVIAEKIFEKSILHIIACYDQDTIIAAVEGNAIHYFDCELNEFRPSFKPEFQYEDENISCLGVSTDDLYLYIGTNRGNIYVYNAPEGKFYRDIIPSKDQNYTKLERVNQIYALKTEDDQIEFFVVLDNSNRLVLFNNSTFKEDKVVNLKINSPTKGAAVSLRDVRRIRLDDSKTELYCITQKNLVRLKLRVNDSKRIIPDISLRLPETNEFEGMSPVPRTKKVPESKLSDYYTAILLMASSSNNILFWSDDQKTLRGMDKKKLVAINPEIDIKSDYIGILRGAHLYASRYQNKLVVLNASQLVEEVYTTKADTIVSRFAHSKKKGKFNLKNVDNPASCLALSPDNKILYSGWEDGKIRLVNLIKKKEEAEIVAVEVLEEADIILKTNTSEPKEFKSPRDFQKRHNRRIVTYVDPLVRDLHNDSETLPDNEFISELSVTALAVTEDYLIAGYSKGSIVFYNPKNNYHIVSVYFNSSGDFENKKSNIIYSLHISNDGKSLIVVTFNIIFSLSLEKETFLSRNEIFSYFNLSMKLSHHDIMTISEAKQNAHNNNLPTAVMGSLVATKLGPKDFIIVNMETGEKSPINVDEKFHGHIVSLGITQDLDKAVVALSKGNILIYDIQSSMLIEEFKLKKLNHTPLKIMDMKITFEGMLIIGLASGELRTIEIATQQEDVRIPQDPKKHKHPIKNIVLSADEEFVALNYEDDWSQKLARLAFYKKKQRGSYRINTDEWISNIKEYPKDSNILLASAFNTVFSIINNEAKEIYSIDDNSVLIEIEQDDEGLILIYSYGRVFRITKEDEKWQVNELPRITQDDEEDLVMIRCARLTKDKKYLVSCFDEKNKILIRKLKTQQEFEIDLKDEAVTMDTHPLESFHFICGVNRDICFYSIFTETNNYYYILENCHQSDIHFLVISNTGNLIASVSTTCEFKLHDWRTKKEIDSFNEKPGRNLERNCLVFAQNDRLLIYCGDQLLKIRNIATKSIIYDFKVHKIFTSISLSKDNSFFYCGTENAEIKLYNMPVTCQEDQIIPFSEVISPYIRIGSLSNILLNFKEQDKWTEELIKHKNLYYWPHNWSILHIIAIMNPHLLDYIPPYSKLPLMCIVDIHGKTPLHYLKDAWDYIESKDEKHISLSQINKIFDYILDFLDAHRSHNYTFFQTMKSMTKIMIFILTYASPELVIRFLRSSFYNQPMLKSIGNTTKNIKQIDIPLIQDDDVKEIYKKGTRWVKFRILGFYMDFDSLSKEAFDLIISLQKITNQNYFNTKALSIIIDHFWNQNFYFNLLIALAFTVLLILISINFGSSDPSFTIQIIILVMIGIFIFYEILQIWSARIHYFKNTWNYIDLTFYSLVIAGIIIQFVGVDDPIQYGWVFTSALLTGYGRWILYLRLFNLSRNLIRTIIDMIKNMWAFITIIASIILGFSLMFYIFNREQNFADALINTYYMLYGNVTFPSLDVSQSILAVTVTFMLGVFFLNMLVAILNDSFADTQKLRVLNDAQERLDIMLESVNVRKLFKRCRTRKDKEGYLIFCETVNDYDKDEVESINIEENVKILNESVKESEFNIQTQLDELKGKIMENEQKIEEMQNVMLKKIDELTLIAKQNLPRSHKSSSKIITAELEVVEKNVFSLDNM